MRVRIGRAFLAGVLLAAVACQQDSLEPSSQPGSDLRSQKEGELSQEYLRTLWQKSEHQQYASLSGDIDPRLGGTISGTPEGWPTDCVFTLHVPAGALPPGLDPVTLTLAAPRPIPGLPPVFKLEPDGLNFRTPVTVTLCYPPWLEPAPCLRKYCLSQSQVSPERYVVSDLELFCAAPGEWTKRVTFHTKHFSRWPVENGKGP